MFNLNDIQKHDIRTRHCFFTGESEIPDFGRFYSVYRDFPCSIAVPSQPNFYFVLEPYPEVVFSIKSSDEDLVVGRIDLSQLASRSGFGADMAQRVISGERDEVWYAEQREKRIDERRKYRIQRNMIQICDSKVAGIVFDTGAMRVFFQDNHNGMGNIGTSSLDEQTFKKIAQSFQFLKSSFFSSLS